jgi:SAM-dependent methyltransferase
VTRRRIQAAYDGMAAAFAEANRAMPAAIAEAAERFRALIGTGALVLDLGCGAGRDLAWLTARRVDVVGVDLSRGMLAQARSRSSGPLLQMDMGRLAFRTGCFEGVWCNASILHLPKPEAPDALAEIARVLVPNGSLFLTVQEGEGEGWEEHSPYGGAGRFVSRYRAEEMEALLVQAGFAIHDRRLDAAGARRWLQYLARRSDPPEADGARASPRVLAPRVRSAIDRARLTG